MISFERETLPNGLRVVVNTDRNTPLVSMALMYDVGAKDEDEQRTGFAHLFEHLMFGGSVHIPDFDTPLEKAGGVSNAYTSNDVTCFYCTLPAENIETAFWLESDRMLSLAFTPQSLEVQRKVVVEEFKQTHINQPYGDATHLFLDLAYKVHPYRWPTIGLCVEHIEEATLGDVKSFFYTHYAPNNAVLSLSGNITMGAAVRLATKWFGSIARRPIAPRRLPLEPPQTALRTLEVERNVPSNALFMNFRMSGRRDPDYMKFDVITDLLSNGRSGRFPTRLVDTEQLFTSLDASVSGLTDPGLLLIGGMLSEGVSYEEAEQAIWSELRGLDSISDQEMEKVRNKYEASIIFETLDIQSRAELLAEHEILGKAEWVNARVSTQRGIAGAEVARCAATHLVEGNCSILRYHSNQS